MNDKRECWDDEARFDRLVDGEISAADYKALLASLDDEPGGWRRLAMAFLEAQALRGELGTLRREQDARSSVGVADRDGVGVASRSASTPEPGSRWMKWLALAACWLAMFGLGVAFDRGLASGWTSSRAPGSSFTRHEKPAESPAAPDERFDPDQPIGNLNLVMEGDDTSETPLSVPVYRADARGLDALANTSALPPEVLRDLERRGHAVRRQQEFVPVELANGMRAIVPVERFEIVPASYRPY